MTQADVTKAIRTLISERLHKGAPPEEAVPPVVRSAIVQAVEAKDPGGLKAQEQVVALVRGALEGLLIMDRDLAEGSLLVMSAVVEASDALSLDRESLMRWALVGVAQAGSLAKPGSLENARARLDEAYMGIGEVFDQTLKELPGRPARFGIGYP